MSRPSGQRGVARDYVSVLIGSSRATFAKMFRRRGRNKSTVKIGDKEAVRGHIDREDRGIAKTRENELAELVEVDYYI